MKLINVISAYATLQKSFGLQFRTADCILRQFSRMMGDILIDEVRPGLVSDFLQGTGPLSATWKVKYSTLSGLYRFAINRGYVETSPLPTSQPKLPPSQSPYVYSTDELRRLINATSTLYVGRSHQQVTMYRTLILVLYGTGLRISEALALTIRDVDLVQRVITVRNTKFFKTRLVPIGLKLAQELVVHIERRRCLPMPAGECSRLFTSHAGRGWGYKHVITLFQRLRIAANISCPPGELRPPRLHDLRHTAAVHRVIAWYQAGKDVQRLLPQLATYLGHVDIGSTQRYLQMTPELLHEASQRFAQYAQCGGHYE